ncbi:CdaR family transcriptional regulator [Cytobacillus dafuensis]|nr:sugar diacid recognition domain-containing protein [Cytobacillus dafuensis]
MLTVNIAKEIVKQTMIRLNRNINIMDKTGTIIASGNLKRMNQAHFGAIEVLRTGRPLIIREMDRHHWEGAYPGINLPIQFQNQIIGVIGITGNPDEIMEFGELVKMITEMIIQHSFLTEQLEWKQHLKELIFEDLINIPLKSETINQRLHLIESKIESPNQVAVVELDLNESTKSDLLQQFEDFFPLKQTLIGFLSVNRIFILALNLPEDYLRQKLLQILSILKSKGIAVRIGIGTPVIDQAHIRYSYDEALCALKLGRKEQPLIAYSEIETKALLDQLDARAKQQFSNRVLGDLSEKLIDTIEQFVAHNLNIGECAKNMYIHRNSLIYRLKKIKEITGYDPQSFHDAMTLQLSIWIWQMEGEE